MPNGAALDQWLARHRRGFLVLLDALAWALSLTVFTALRYLDVPGFEWAGLATGIAIAIGLQLAIGTALWIYEARNIWAPRRMPSPWRRPWGSPRPSSR